MAGPRFAIIPTNGRACFTDCYHAIRPQVDLVVVIETGPSIMTGHDATVVLKADTKEVNISRWWNQGLDYIAKSAERAARIAGEIDSRVRPVQWEVAILNDDAIVPDDWFQAVTGVMRGMRVAAACSGSPYSYPILHTKPGPVNLMTRMQGFAFILAGEKGVRANEQLKWYFSDDHVDWCSRQHGGMVMIPGHHVKHLYPNAQMSPELQIQTGLDAQAFQSYWGNRPW